MTSLDHHALRDIGRHMARTNGYRPEQGSDLYITHGRVAGLPVWQVPGLRVHVRDVEPGLPEDALIAPETGRNKEAVLWLAERAWCPLSVLGAAVRQVHCGALDDDFEVAGAGPSTPTAPTPRPRPTASRAATRREHERRRHDAPAVDDAVRAGRVRDRAGGRLLGRRQRPRRPDDDPVHADHAAAGTGQRLGFRWLLRPRGQQLVGRPPSRDRRGGRHPDGRVGIDRIRARSPGTGGPRRSAWTPGRATRSGSGSRPSTVVRTRPSRRASTTCTSRARRTDLAAQSSAATTSKIVGATASGA